MFVMADCLPKNNERCDIALLGKKIRSSPTTIVIFSPIVVVSVEGHSYEGIESLVLNF